MLSQNPNEDCYSPVDAFDGNDVTNEHLVPKCPSEDNGTVVYLSHADTMLLRYDRSYQIDRQPVDVVISYRSVQPSPVPSGGECSYQVHQPVVVFAGLLVAVTAASTFFRATGQRI
jgi:hypothetical protein